MKVSAILKMIIVSFTVIIVSFVVLTISNQREREAVSTQAAFKQLGLDLSNASDFLTNQARAYVQYGEKKYYDDYMTEVEVTKTRENVVAELKRLGAPESELSLVEKAAALSNTLAQLETRAFEAVERGDLETARELMFGSEYENGKAPIVSTMGEFQKAMNDRTSLAASQARTRSDIMLIVFSVLFIGTAILITTALMSINKKMKAIAELADCARHIALGDTDIQIQAQSNDEVGVLADSFRTMLAAIQQQIATVQRIAEGDLTAQVTLRSDVDVMGAALEKTIDSLNEMFSEIHASTAQVEDASRQIADAAQSMAQGSTEQSEAVEKLSASIGSVAFKTNENAEIAREAAELSTGIKRSAEKGTLQMDEMMQAVREINEASLNIHKVIKVIDDIAFQTNILALNAAVEAARAGQHGKGFAVVAEEVRNLAAKSAEAAKETSGLIDNSVEKANLGLQIATETSVSLNEIVDGINRSADIVLQIAQSSDEQSGAIADINEGIAQVAMVVHQNSATSQQSAAASEEMSGQASFLAELIDRFKLKNTRQALSRSPETLQGLSSGRETFSMPSRVGDSMGKY